MKRLLAALAIIGFLSPLAFAGSIRNSKHDLSSSSSNNALLKASAVDEVCVFCHTPHQASGANKQYPLWNHTLSSETSYTLYNSATLNATISSWGGGTAGTASTSQLCMSCHDATVGVGSLYNDPNIGTPSNSNTKISGTPAIGTDLSNDHPVNFTYDASLVAADGELVLANDANVTALLSGGTVQCSSCHDVHDPEFSPFLVKSNAASALCLTCHVK